jgi:hypothetical protein
MQVVIIADLELKDEEDQIIEKIRSSALYAAYEEQKTKTFFAQG